MHVHALASSGLAAFEPRLRSVVSLCSVRARLLAPGRRFPNRVSAARGAAAPLPPGGHLYRIGAQGSEERTATHTYTHIPLDTHIHIFTRLDAYVRRYLHTFL